jgi:glycosyltransferase involved in cell wall biosynthesis
LEHKNHLTLIRALPKIAANYPGATLLLTIEPGGHNRRVGTSYTHRMRQLAGELGISDRIVWLGALTQAEVKYLLQQATVAVFPSLDESFGLPLAEAITEGCPLAASDLPFAREVAGPAAVYFDPLDPDSIAACVTDLLARPEVRRQVAEHAREQRARFKPEWLAERIATIIENAALRGPAAM